MDKKQLELFQKSIIQHRDSLMEIVNSGIQENKYILGNQTVKDVLHVVSELKDVLEKIHNGSFGKCELCDGEVEIEHLHLDCTAGVCLDHYSPDQIRELERDLELAGKLQKQLLPCCVPSMAGMEIAFYCEPFNIVGGDYYDFFLNRNGAQGFAVADVMGKGLPASMLMSNLQASLRILSTEHEELHSLAQKLNEVFRYNTKLIRFISLFLATIDLNQKTLKYCNAGHHPALLWKDNSTSIKWLMPTGPAIGLIHNPEYVSKSITLDHGDLLLMYTDGLSEARNDKNEDFGDEHIVHYIKENHEKPIKDFVLHLFHSVKKFANKLNDDVTLMAIKIT